MRTAAANVARAMQTVGGGLILLLMLSQLVVVAMRYIFALGWPWALDLLVYCFFLSALLPMIFVVLADASVRVDILYSGYSPELRRRLDSIALIGLLASSMGYAAWASWGNTVRSWQIMETSPTYGGLPGYFLLKTTLTAVFAGLAVTAVAKGLQRDRDGTASGDGR